MNQLKKYFKNAADSGLDAAKKNLLELAERSRMLLKWNREEINNLVRNTLINCKTMRKKNVLMSAIAALAFAACSSDDVLLEQDTGL